MTLGLIVEWGGCLWKGRWGQWSGVVGQTSGPMIPVFQNKIMFKFVNTLSRIIEPCVSLKIQEAPPDYEFTINKRYNFNKIS